MLLSEVLCYLQITLARYPVHYCVLTFRVSTMRQRLLKNILFTTVRNMNLGLDDIPRNRQRRAGDSNSKLDTDDIHDSFV